MENRSAQYLRTKTLGDVYKRRRIGGVSAEDLREANKPAEQAPPAKKEK